MRCSIATMSARSKSDVLLRCQLLTEQASVLIGQDLGLRLGHACGREPLDEGVVSKIALVMAAI